MALAPNRTKPAAISLLAICVALLLYYFLDLELLLPSTSLVNLEQEASHGGNASVLLVTSFFPAVNASKVFAEQSKKLEYLLSNIRSDIYVFTPPDMEETVRNLRGNLPLTINTTFTTPMEIPPLLPHADAYKDMHKKQRPKPRSIKSYALSTSKPYFLEQGLSNTRLGGKNYNYAFWIDYQAFHSHHAYLAWPSPDRLADVWHEGTDITSTKADDLIFVPMTEPPHSTMRFWSEGMGPISSDFSSTSFFGGRTSTIPWLVKAFYAYHNEYLAYGQFVGNGQSIVNSIVVLYPQRFITIWPTDPQPSLPDGAPHSQLESELPIGSCGEPRQLYQFFLASEPARGVMLKKFKAAASIWHNWPWKWRPAEWLHSGTPCQLPNPRSMLQVLHRAFDNNWHAPGASLQI